MDNVNHPAHYNTGKYESIDVMVETQGINAVKNFCICNAFKYIYRHRFKNGTEDIKKAIWYLNKYVELNELTTNESQTDCDTCKWKHIADDAHCGLCGCAGIDNYEPELVGKSADAMYIDESWATCEPTNGEREGK